MKTGDIARVLGLTLTGDPEREISGVAGLASAGPNQAAYLESVKHLDRAAGSQAGCLIVPLPVPDALRRFNLLASSHPKYEFARLAAMLHPTLRPQPGVHPTAIVDRSVTTGSGVSVGPYTVIAENATLTDGATIGAFCFVGPECRVGEDTLLHSRVTLYAGVRLGARVVIHSGTVIGSDGFGYVPHEGGHFKFPQIGTVEIGDDVEIGSNVSIDRGALGCTRIGRGTKIDNLVQVAHNVTIGEDCVIAAQTGISGSAIVEDHAVIAGQVGVADHVRIERNAIVGAQAGIPTGKTIRAGDFVWGTPARSMTVFKEQYGSLSRLPLLRREFLELKKRVAELEAMFKNRAT